MALRLEDKKLLVKEVNAVAADSVTAVAAIYRGLSVPSMARRASVFLTTRMYTPALRALLRSSVISDTDKPL